VGLPLFAPVSATITVLGTWVLIGIAALAFIVQVVRQSPAVGPRHALSVGAWLFVAVGAACAAYLLILQLGRPVAENQAMTKLANAIATPGLLDFDPRLTESDRRVVVQSKPSAWQLYFSSPMFIGYDFNLSTGDGRYIGARVTPSTIWSASERIWVFPEVSRSTDRPAQ
jgi:phosphate/sulfate permease